MLEYKPLHARSQRTRNAVASGQNLIGGLLPFALIVGGIYGISQIIAATDEPPSKAVLEAREATFQTVCPSYFNASSLDRWSSDRIARLKWCEDYKHRL